MQEFGCIKGTLDLESSLFALHEKPSATSFSVFAGKLVSSVCHGAEIFKLAVDGQGVPIVKGKVGKAFYLVL